MTFNSLAINISVGGLLLGATPSLPVGSECKVSLSLPGIGMGREVSARGTVVRSDEKGTAIRFERAFAEDLCARIVSHSRVGLGHSVFTAYLDYFTVSRAKHHEGCEQLLGVSKRAFRNLFLTTFSTCIVLSVVPVWLFRHDLAPLANWIKICISFVYALLWMAVLQPVADLFLLRFLRNRKVESAADWKG